MKHFLSKKKLILAGIIVILLAGGLSYVFFIHDNQISQRETQDRDGINYGPPTEQDKKDVEDNKEEIAKDQEKDPDPSSDEGAAASYTPLITYLGQYDQVIEASGQVTGVFEDGGTCTLQLVQGSMRVSKSTKGFKDFNHVTCTAFSIPRSEFAAAGTWTATLSYESTSGKGVSQSRTVEVR